MSTVSFKESLKYGGRLFGLWLGVTVLGGVFTTLGGYLGVSELQSLITDGTAAVETATLAGGAILAILGAVTLIIGNFALVYKLLADSVSRGRMSAERLEDAPAETTTEETVTTTEPSTETQPEQQPRQPEPSPRTEPTPEQESQPAASEETSQQPAEVPASEQPTAETVRQPADEQPAAGAGSPTGATETTVEESTEPGQRSETDPREPPSAPATDHATGDDQSDGQHGGQDQDEPEQAPGSQSARERTAEEIAFGAGDEGTGSEETTPVDDEEWFDEEDTETVDEESDEQRDRRDVETANNSSADPLGDQFD